MIPKVKPFDVWTLFIAFLVGACIVWVTMLVLNRPDPVIRKLATVGITDVLQLKGPGGGVICDTGKGYMFTAKNITGGPVIGKVCPDNTIHIMINVARGDYPTA